MSRRDVNLHKPLSRRDVIFTPLCDVATWDSNVATWFEPTLCHVATLPPTSRRCLVKLSVTSRRDPVFSPRMVHFGPSHHTPSLIGTLAPLRTNLHRTCRSSHPTGRRPSTAHRPPVFPFESPFSAGFGS